MNSPKIPVGLSTKLGLIGAVVAGLVAGIAAFAGGDHTEETITGIVSAALLLYKIMDGRYNQAVANTVVAEEVEDDFSNEPDEPHTLEAVPEPQFEVKGGPQA